MVVSKNLALGRVTAMRQRSFLQRLVEIYGRSNKKYRLLRASDYFFFPHPARIGDELPTVVSSLVLGERARCHLFATLNLIFFLVDEGVIYFRDD